MNLRPVGFELPIWLAQSSGGRCRRIGAPPSAMRSSGDRGLRRASSAPSSGSASVSTKSLLKAGWALSALCGASANST